MEKKLNNEVIFVRLNGNDKNILVEEAKKLGLSLTAYCRMILLKSITVSVK